MTKGLILTRQKRKLRTFLILILQMNYADLKSSCKENKVFLSFTEQDTMCHFAWMLCFWTLNISNQFINEWICSLTWLSFKFGNWLVHLLKFIFQKNNKFIKFYVSFGLSSSVELIFKGKAQKFSLKHFNIIIDIIINTIIINTQINIIIILM